ncbi:hypothetical protein BD779DRAFT_1748636 [Infundibulicybe gibba]|nr:hypothetical protein BD779DRAFT_1748636 [Infundibulicybe gibba]
MAPTVRGVEWAYARTSEADHGAELAGGPKLNGCTRLGNTGFANSGHVQGGGKAKRVHPNGFANSGRECKVKGCTPINLQTSGGSIRTDQRGGSGCRASRRAGAYARTSEAGQGAELAGGPKPNGCTQLGNTGFANNGGRAKRHSGALPCLDRRSPAPASGGDKDTEMPDAPGETSESSARKSTFIGLDNDDHGIAIAEVVLDTFTDITKFFAVNDYLSNDTDGGGIPPDKVKMLGITALGAIRAIETRMGFTVKELAETEADDTITSPAAAAALGAPTAGSSRQVTRAPPPVFTPPASRPALHARIEGSLARRVDGADQLPAAPARGRKRTRKRKPKERDPNAPPPAPLSIRSAAPARGAPPQGPPPSQEGPARPTSAICGGSGRGGGRGRDILDSCVDNYDILFLQELRYSLLRNIPSSTDREGEPIHGFPTHPSWILVERGGPSRVVVYVSKTIASTNPRLCSHIMDHPDLVFDPAARHERKVRMMSSWEW